MKLTVLGLAAGAIALSSLFAVDGSAIAQGSGAPFTAVQAAQGQKVFAQSCAACHGANLKGVSAPALIGKTSGIAQQSVVEVYEYVSQQMPMTAPGSLSKAQFLSVVAYILEKNGHKPGARPLTEAVATSETTEIAAHP
jgi:mono/diheme cytochrome c family protein